MESFIKFENSSSPVRLFLNEENTQSDISFKGLFEYFKSEDDSGQQSKSNRLVVAPMCSAQVEDDQALEKEEKTLKFEIPPEVHKELSKRSFQDEGVRRLSAYLAEELVEDLKVNDDVAAEAVNEITNEIEKSIRRISSVKKHRLSSSLKRKLSGEKEGKVLYESSSVNIALSPSLLVYLDKEKLSESNLKEIAENLTNKMMLSSQLYLDNRSSKKINNAIEGALREVSKCAASVFDIKVRVSDSLHDYIARGKLPEEKLGIVARQLAREAIHLHNDKPEHDDGCKASARHLKEITEHIEQTLRDLIPQNLKKRKSGWRGSYSEDKSFLEREHKKGKSFGGYDKKHSHLNQRNNTFRSYYDQDSINSSQTTISNSKHNYSKKSKSKKDNKGRHKTGSFRKSSSYKKENPRKNKTFGGYDQHKRLAEKSSEFDREFLERYHTNKSEYRPLSRHNRSYSRNHRNTVNKADSPSVTNNSILSHGRSDSALNFSYDPSRPNHHRQVSTIASHGQLSKRKHSFKRNLSSRDQHMHEQVDVRKVSDKVIQQLPLKVLAQVCGVDEKFGDDKDALLKATGAHVHKADLDKVTKLVINKLPDQIVLELNKLKEETNIKAAMFPSTSYSL